MSDTPAPISAQRVTYTSHCGVKRRVARRPGETDIEFGIRIHYGTFDDLARRYIDWAGANHPPASVDTYRSNINTLLMKPLGELWLVDCRTASYNTLLERLGKLSLSRLEAGTRTLNALVSYAIGEDEWPEHVPAFGGIDTRSTKTKRAKRRVGANSDNDFLWSIHNTPTWADACEISDAMHTVALERRKPEQVLHLAEFPKLQFATGTRIGETITLRSDDVSAVDVHVQRQFGRKHGGLSDGELMPTSPPKNGKTRHATIWEAVHQEYILPLSEEAAAQRGGWLLGPPEPRVAWLKTLEDLYKQAQGRIGYPWTSHAHRHAFASINLAPTHHGGNGRTINEVAAWLGDNPDTVIKTYYHDLGDTTPNTYVPTGFTANSRRRRP